MDDLLIYLTGMAAGVGLTGVLLLGALGFRDRLRGRRKARVITRVQ